MDRSTAKAENGCHKSQKVVFGALVFLVAAVAVVSFAPEIKSVTRSAVEAVLREERQPETVKEQAVRAQESDAQRKQAIRILGLYAIGMPVGILFLLLIAWVFKIWPAAWHLSFLHYITHPQ